MDRAKITSSTRAAHAEAKAPAEPSHLTDEYFAALASATEVTASDLRATGEPAPAPGTSQVMAAPAKGVAPEAYAYYYVYGHSVAFAGSIGSVVYYKNVNPSTWACGTSLWRAYWYGREITGRYCSGSHVWKIKLRMVVADV